MYHGITCKAFDCYWTVVAWTYRIGIGIDTLGGIGLGIGGCRAIDLQAVVGTDVNITCRGMYGKTNNLVGEERTVGRSETLKKKPLMTNASTKTKATAVSNLYSINE